MADQFFITRYEADSSLEVNLDTSNSFSIEFDTISTWEVEFKEPVNFALEFRTDSDIALRFDQPLQSDPTTGKVAYRVLLVDMDGTAIAELENASISNIVWAQNGEYDSADFSLPITDPKIAHIVCPKTEVQFWRGKQMIFWGLCYKSRTNSGDYSVQVVSLDWYFSRRVVGEVPKRNYIKNSTFEGNWNGWNDAYHRWSKPAEAPIVSLSKGNAIVGNYALRLRASGQMDEFTYSADDMFTAWNNAVLSATGNAVCAYAANFSPTKILDVTVYHDSKTLSVQQANALTQQRADVIAAKIRSYNPKVLVTSNARGGQSPYIGSNKTAAGRAQNRRAEFSALKLLSNTKKKPGQLVVTEAKVTNPVSYGRPVEFVLRTWIYVEKFLAPPGNNCGIELLVIDPRKPYAKKKYARPPYNWKLVTQRLKYPITADTPVGKWVRTELRCKIPNDGLPYKIHARLYAIVGSVLYDDIALYADGSIRCSRWAQRGIMAELVRHAQDTTIGKSDLNIGFTTVGSSNDTVRDREYRWSERENILELLNEFPTLADGAEWSIETTPTTRKLVCYPYKTQPYGQLGGRGKQWNPYSLRLGDNLTSVEIDEDGSDVGTVIIVRKDGGQGIAREEGTARDTSQMGGLVLEKVYDSTPQSSNSSLYPQAQRGLERYKKPVRIPSVTTDPKKCSEILENVSIGDRLLVLATDGGNEYEGKTRVQSMSLDPSTDVITFTLTPLDGSN